MLELNQKDYQTVEKLFGKENIHVMHYIPEYYQMRDRCKAVVQTGDYGVHAQAILIAGYPSDERNRRTAWKQKRYFLIWMERCCRWIRSVLPRPIPMEWLKEGLKHD